MKEREFFSVYVGASFVHKRWLVDAPLVLTNRAIVAYECASEERAGALFDHVCRQADRQGDVRAVGVVRILIRATNRRRPSRGEQRKCPWCFTQTDRPSGFCRPEHYAAHQDAYVPARLRRPEPTA